jgi:starch phosphorylase
MEASGTGNMKLALNGALTIGTLDGANVEIRERVGDENIFIFGLTAPEVAQYRKHGLEANETISSCAALSDAITAIETGAYSHDERHRFANVTNALRYTDYYLVTADFDSYFATQRRIEEVWLAKPRWTRSSIVNIANMGWFSSDRAIREYAEEIWKVS